MDIDLTNKGIKIAINPEFEDDVMFCEGYEQGVACTDFGPGLRGKHAIGIRVGPNRIDRKCALVTHKLIEVVEWEDDYFKIVKGED